VWCNGPNEISIGSSFDRQLILTRPFAGTWIISNYSRNDRNDQQRNRRCTKEHGRKEQVLSIEGRREQTDEIQSKRVAYIACLTARRGSMSTTPRKIFHDLGMSLCLKFYYTQTSASTMPSSWYWRNAVYIRFEEEAMSHEPDTDG
jgi:hypothetical protein